MPNAERALLHRGGRRGTWGSLGLWHGNEEDYAGACEALALAVGQAAGIGAGDHVLSLACGAGDELTLWLDHAGAAQVHGVDINGHLVQAAQHRFAARVQPLQPSPVRLHVGSGTALHELGLAQGEFDRVVCVDAAYHLNPREAFLRGAWAALRPGGTLAYTDLCLDPKAKRAWLLHAAARACGLAPGGLLKLAPQHKRLLALGFEDVRMQRLDEAVLDGFARYVRQQGPRIARTALHRDWRRPAITARLIGPCRAAGLGYALISARKPLDAGDEPAPAASMAPATPKAERTALSSSGTPASA
jgi:microcystin synthetase protein McyJ